MIHPVGAELFHVGGRTDRHKAIIASLDLVNAPKHRGSSPCHILPRLGGRIILGCYLTFRVTKAANYNNLLRTFRVATPLSIMHFNIIHQSRVTVMNII